MNSLTMQVCLLTAFTALCGPVWAGETSPDKDCRLKQLASIDLKIGTFVLVPVTVDGAPAFMGLNTGSPVPTISKQAAGDLNLAVGAFRGHSDSQLASVKSFSIGSYEVGPVQFLVTKNPPAPDPALPPFIGFIPLTDLIGVDFELDYAHNKLNLFSTNHCAGKVVYWTDKGTWAPYSLDKIGVILFPVELDGKKIAAKLEAGGATTWMRTDFSKALYGFDEKSPDIRTETLDSGKTINHYRAMKISAPGLSVLNADVRLYPGAKNCTVSKRGGPDHSAVYANCYGIAPMTLGLDVLRHLRLYFATQEHILYFSNADATLPATP